GGPTGLALSPHADARAALEARPARTAVHPEPRAQEAPPRRARAPGQVRLHEPRRFAHDPAERVVVERAHLREGIDPREEEHLRLVLVADARHERLAQERVADR